MKRILMMCVACIAVSGCESTKVSSSTASTGEVYAFARPGAPDDARIVFTQDSTVISCFGAGMQVYLDEKLAAETGSGESVSLYHKPGPTQLSIKNKASCAGGDLKGLLLDLKPGYSYQVRGYRGTWDKAEPLLTSPEPYQYKK